MKPFTVIVLTAKVACTTRNTVVVADNDNRVGGALSDELAPAAAEMLKPWRFVKEPVITAKAAEFVLRPVLIAEVVVDPAGTNSVSPQTSQSPAVSETLVAFAGVELLIEVPVVVFVRYSPTLPAFALLFVVVPTMPFVCEGVKLPVLLSVVNAPVFAAVLPIEGGEANKFVNPVPLTAELAESVVNAPVFAAVLPMGGGDARKVVKPVPLTVELAASVVKLPVFGVVAPMLPFSAPPVELSVVAVTAAGVVCPIGVLSIVPPVIATLFAFCVAIVPKPRFVRAPLTVPDPVPPLAIPIGVVAVTVVKAPVLGVVLPTGVLSKVLAVIATPLSVPEVAWIAETVGLGYVPDRSPPAGPVGGTGCVANVFSAIVVCCASELIPACTSSGGTSVPAERTTYGRIRN